MYIKTQFNKKKKKKNPRKEKHISYNTLSRRGEKLIYAKPFGWLPDVLLATVLRCYDATMLRCCDGTWGAWGFWDFGLVSVWFGLLFPCSTQSNFIYFCFVFYFFASFFFFFFGSHCCMWHMANRCRTSSFESQQRKKKIPLTWVPVGRGIYNIT